MSSAAEQYRNLVNRLESILEAPGDDPAADQGSFTPPEAPTAPTAPTAPAGIPTIEAPTFNKAYAQAAKQGLKVFKWCGTYRVQAAKKPSGASTQPSPQLTQPNTRQFDPSVGQPGRSTGALSPNSGSDLPISA